MVQRTGIAQEVPWATVNALGPFFTPGLRPVMEEVLTGTAASIIFNDIPGGYRHLVVAGWARTDRAAENDVVCLRFNNDSGANSYDWMVKGAQASNVFAATGATATNLIQIALIEAANSRAAVFTPFYIWISWYRLATPEKFAFCSNSGAFGDRSALADLYIRDYRGAWRSSNAITRIDLFPTIGPNFVAGCRFTLYGML